MKKEARKKQVNKETQKIQKQRNIDPNRKKLR